MNISTIYLSVCLSIDIYYLFIYLCIDLFIYGLIAALLIYAFMFALVYASFIYAFIYASFIYSCICFFFVFFLMHVLKWINWLVDVGWSWLMNVHIEQSWNLDKGEAQISIHWHTILTSCFNLFFNLFAAIYSWSRVVGWRRNKFI